MTISETPAFISLAACEGLEICEWQNEANVTDWHLRGYLRTQTFGDKTQELQYE